MAAPATPRRGFLGRLVGSISQYVATPTRTTPPNNEALPQMQPTSIPTPRSTHPPLFQDPPQSEPWRPGMIQSKYLLEYENIFDDIAPTPQRRPAQRPKTCPPKHRTMQAAAIDIPRSAMKKRSAPADDDEPATPSNNKRVKFNETLTQERILSPTQPGERECVPLHPLTCGKKRPRATDPYAGKHFADSPNIFDNESPSKKARYETSHDSTRYTNSTPTTQNNTNMNITIRSEDDGYFVPNRTQPRPGTFELNYDTYGQGDNYSEISGDEESALAEAEVEAESTQKYNPPTVKSVPGRFVLEYSDDSTNPDTSSLLNDSTPTPAQFHQPVTTTTPPPFEPSTTQNEQETNHLEVTDDTPPTPPVPPNAAAIDAEMDALPWPKPVTYVDAGIASQHVIDLLNDRYDKDDEYYAQLWWDREFSKFDTALKTAKFEGREVEIAV